SSASAAAADSAASRKLIDSSSDESDSDCDSDSRCREPLTDAAASAAATSAIASSSSSSSPPSSSKSGRFADSRRTIVREASSLYSMLISGSMPRFRRPLLLLMLILITNLTLYLLFRPFPQLESFVQDTNKRIHTGVSAIRGGINAAAGSAVGGSRSAVGDLDADETYLEYLGLLGRFESHPAAASASSSKQQQKQEGSFKLAKDAGSLGFIVASSVSTSDYVYAFDLLDSVRANLNDTLLVLMDTGLHMSDLNKLKKRCNVTTRCRIEAFDFDKFPSHVQSTGTNAFKPLAIQMLLKDYGGVIWSDLRRTPYYFVVDAEEIAPTLTAARRVGIQAWTIPPPASALTHPQTFAYLNADPRDFYFLHMVASAHLVLYYTEFLHTRVMLPWVKCALNSDCWQPLGAHQSGCDFNRPPYFKYSGCHFYDMSALNVVLGLAFQFNVTAYECRQKVFGYNSNDTVLENHFKVPGINFDDLRRRAGAARFSVVEHSRMKCSAFSTPEIAMPGKAEGAMVTALMSLRKEEQGTAVRDSLQR
uniref:Nucleotid_trans domain-containing protein n=1 Tax=Macrostomum lignano TaxID=282301 RepID=A0A1I8G8V7_9PLAT